MKRLYLLPLIGTGSNIDPRRPKYLQTVCPTSEYSLMDYGAEPLCLVVVDVNTSQHGILSAFTDVAAFPINLQQTVGTSLFVMQQLFDAMNLPSDWIESSDTFSQVVQRIMRIFQFAQRLHSLHADRLFTGGVTLDTLLNAVPSTVRIRLQNAAETLQYDTREFSDTVSLRQLLTNVRNQYAVGNILLDTVG